jgi:pimeloyl-ACP methyl ester carboxylesterase
MTKRLAALAAALLSAGCAGAAAAEPATAPADRPAECAAGFPEGTRCGTIGVPEDWEHPGGRTIDLNYALVPGSRDGGGARRDDPAPLTLLAGGPGQGAVEVGPALLAELRSVAPEADILLVDQRGTGRSNRLACEGGFEMLSTGQEALVRRCIAELETHASLAHYRTQDAVRDLETVRERLGLARLDLVAASYGTRLAGAYMRAHPDRVRTAILRAAAPPDFNIVGEGLVNADAEIARVAEACAADARCAADYPRLGEQIRDLEQRLDSRPERVRAPDRSTIVVTDDLFAQTLYAMMLTAAGRQQIPLAVATAAQAGFQPLAPVLLQVRDQLYGALPVGLYLSVVCAEDVPRIDASAPTPETGFASGIPELIALCRTWPAGRPDPSLFEPLTTSVPTLIISGALDPATTVAAAERLRATLPQARHVVVPATAHAPVFPECVRPLARTLLDTGRLPEAQADCSALTLPPFARRPASADRR